MSKIEDVSLKKILTIEPFVDKKQLKKEEYAKKPRDQWDSSAEFFISALGYAVGLGNVWRYPYLCYKNGGGAFIIPYFTCMMILGIPLVYLEMVVGQFTSNGPLTAWKMIKLYKGIGLAMNIANALMIIYYNMVLAYCVYYMFMSIRLELPWIKCRPSFASPNCVDDFSPENYSFTRCTDAVNMLKCSDAFNIGRCFNSTTINGTLATCDTDRNALQQIGWWKTSFPSEDFWNQQVLQKSSGIDDAGTFSLPLFFSLIVAWLMVYFLVFKGVKVSGKLVWFTAIFPYAVLILLGIRGWMLPGADIGIKFYIIPKWDRLGEIQVWRDAAIQIFFTLSTGYGGLNTLASYNSFNHNIQRDAILIPMANCVTSFFAGFVIFAYMGYLSQITQQDIGDIIQAGQGLAFVVYPYAVTTISGAPFWSFMFFLMLLTLGLDTTMTCVESSITSILDAFPLIKRDRFKKYSMITSLHMFYFVSGIIFCFGSGTYWMEWFSTYVGDWAVLISGFVECIIVAWFYGIRNFEKDIDCMLGKKYSESWTRYIWWPLWTFITPFTCLALAILTLVNHKVLTLGEYQFPEWSFKVGISMTASSLVGFFGWMLYEIFDTLFIKKKSFVTLFTPDFEAYQPHLEENKSLVRIARGLGENDVEEFQDKMDKV